MDEEIREAIARMAAKAEGKHWPEQKLSDEPLHFRKPDEIRIPGKASDADESSLANGLLLDSEDERELASVPVQIDDEWRPSDAIRLDESKFLSGGRTGSIEPLEAEARSIETAGEAVAKAKPVLKRSSVYHIAPASESYHSTIDLDTDELLRPTLVIRPPATSATTPE